MARALGWPTGEILANNGSIPEMLAFLVVIWIVVKSFILFHWWRPILISIAAWLLALILVMTLKAYVQHLCIIGIVPAFVFVILYVSEKKPIGMASKIFG